ncbi:hypothetical protein TMatcc_008756 [Talaromyces marneffei ATCC 18224]
MMNVSVGGYGSRLRLLYYYRTVSYRRDTVFITVSVITYNVTQTFGRNDQPSQPTLVGQAPL